MTCNLRFIKKALSLICPGAKQPGLLSGISCNWYFEQTTSILFRLMQLYLSASPNCWLSAMSIYHSHTPPNGESDRKKAGRKNRPAKHKSQRACTINTPSCKHWAAPEQMCLIPPAQRAPWGLPRFQAGLALQQSWHLYCDGIDCTNNQPHVLRQGFLKRAPM